MCALGKRTKTRWFILGKRTKLEYNFLGKRTNLVLKEIVANVKKKNRK